MTRLHIEPVAHAEFIDAALWYESQRRGLGEAFVAEVEHTLQRIETADRFVTAPIATVRGRAIRREFVRRFPYVVIFVELPLERRVIMIRRASSDPATWKSRI